MLQEFFCFFLSIYSVNREREVATLEEMYMPHLKYEHFCGAVIALNNFSNFASYSFFKVKSHVCTHVTDGIKLKYFVERHLNTIPTLSNCLSTTAPTTGLSHGEGQNIRHIIHSDLHTKQLTLSNVSLTIRFNETVQVSSFFTYSIPCMLFFLYFLVFFSSFSLIFVSLFNFFVENIA